MKNRFRLLPTIIFVSALTLTVKLGSIWEGISVLGPSAAVAADDTKAAAEQTAEKGAEAGPAADGKTPAQPAAAADARAAGEGAPGGRPRFDPDNISDAELQVLEKLFARREELDKRAEELDRRDILLKATEKRIESKIAELKTIQSTIESLLKKHDEEQDAKMKSLVKIYEAMKPKDAARIWEKLELNILLDVIERMREAKVAPVLANMDPSKAKTVTSAMASRRELPSPSQIAPN